MLPEPHDGIEVGAVGRKVDRLDVVSVQSCAFVPTGVVEHQINLFALLGRDFLGHGVEEGLEDLGVAVGDDKADHSTGRWFDRAHDVAPVMGDSSSCPRHLYGFRKQFLANGLVFFFVFCS